MSASSINKFSILISVKPYVKRYLEINYGSPLDLTTSPAEHKIFNNWLQKPSTRYDNRIPDLISYYTETVEIMISEHDFYKYGWELTKTNTVSFNVHFEQQAKLFMRIIVGSQISLGMSINKSILMFQEKFNYSEDIWPYASIKKDFYRNGYSDLINFEHDIFNKIHNIIMRNLSDLGTLSQKAILHYENDTKTRR